MAPDDVRRLHGGEQFWWRAGLEMLAVGSLAAAVAYGVGAFVDGLTA